MTQPEIMTLLKEAAAAGCTKERHCQIEMMLRDAACPQGFPSSTFSVMMGQTRLSQEHYTSWDVGNLFQDMAINRPDLLPRQAAYFLMACRGDKKEPVDYSLIEAELR
jgi:hypothetical protein